MKTIRLIVGVSLVVLASHAGAGQQNQPSAVSPSKTKPGTKAAVCATKPKQEQEVMITGSMIPRKVRRSGWITDSVSPVAIIDRRSIELSGARDVADALRRAGLNR